MLSADMAMLIHCKLRTLSVTLGHDEVSLLRLILRRSQTHRLFIRPVISEVCCELRRFSAAKYNFNAERKTERIQEKLRKHFSHFAVSGSFRFVPYGQYRAGLIKFY